MKKAEFLNHWNGIKPNQTVKPCVVPYKHQGSTFAEDGIRLTGSKQFIDSILSRLKDLLQYENCETRLQLNYQQATDRHTDRKLDSYCCYVQVHGRGRESIMTNLMLGGL